MASTPEERVAELKLVLPPAPKPMAVYKPAVRVGNLVYRRTARNFNPVMATAARVTIAEVEELVEPGQIDPDYVITPGIFVRHIIRGKLYEKRIEKRTVQSG